MRSFYAIIEKTRVKKIRFHDLRHTHCTMLLGMDIHPKKVAERVGHKDSRMMDRYSHIVPNMQKETANRFGDMFYKKA
ncbi:tyrosine-type recombinase/integrase [Gorillibacterium massiliense]|uniref:tyrosine-type recombinase/integrase n=1 Tax=Gorillibacterium massiliense TaxID=1280390 RepID=UPI000592673E|nr:tyrosine-type recombinase/integrase [Gorillibacterium massiliense]